MRRADGHGGWVWRGLGAAVGCVGVGVGVVVVAVGDLLASAHGADVFTTADAGVVELGVMGAEAATAAVPQSCHVDIGRE